MRINVYHEELTSDAEIVWTEPRPGVRYCGLRIFQKSAPELHDKPEDDDRSAITFWLGSLVEVGRFLAKLGIVAALAKAREGAHPDDIPDDPADDFSF